MLEAGRAFAPGDNWIHPHFVLCGVPDEAALIQAINRLERRGISYRDFRELDRNNEVTAVATAPLIGEQRRAMSCYRLFAREGRIDL